MGEGGIRHTHDRKMGDARRGERCAFGGRVLIWRIFIKEIIHLVSYEEADLMRGASGMHPRSIVGASWEHAWSMQGASEGHWGNNKACHWLLRPVLRGSEK